MAVFVVLFQDGSQAGFKLDVVEDDRELLTLVYSSEIMGTVLLTFALMILSIQIALHWWCSQPQCIHNVTALSSSRVGLYVLFTC